MNYYTSNAYLSIKDFWDEPDVWEETINGYYCCARRNHAKAWCGYVRVPSDHPMVPNENLDCHGDVTWNSDRAPWMNAADKGFHWYGFDCLHYLDLSPRDAFKEAVNHDSWKTGYLYRNLKYVQENIRSLAQQLKALEEVPGHA